MILSGKYFTPGSYVVRYSAVLTALAILPIGAGSTQEIDISKYRVVTIDVGGQRVLMDAAGQPPAFIAGSMAPHGAHPSAVRATPFIRIRRLRRSALIQFAYPSRSPAQT